MYVQCQLSGREKVGFGKQTLTQLFTLRSTQKTRGHSLRLEEKRFNLQIRKGFFTVRALSHGRLVQVRLPVFLADLNGRSVLLYGAADVSGDMPADIRPAPIRQS